MDRQHLLSRLARRGWPVVYSDGALSVWDRHTDRWKNAGLVASSSNIPEAPIVIAEPGRLFSRWPKVPAWDRFVIRRHTAHLRRLAGKTDGAIAFIADPSHAPYLDSLRARWLVFYIFDAWTPSGWSDDDTAVNDPDLSHNLHTLCERAQLIVSIAPSMARVLPDGAGDRAKILPHGVNAMSIMSGASMVCPSDLGRIPSPRIGYIGRVNPKLDLRLVQAVAQRLPDVHWVFIGWLQGMTKEHQHLWKQCLALNNVHFLGQKPQDSLPAYFAHLNATVMCYRVEGAGYSWQAVFPIKLFEYLAAGKPVISTALENVKPFEHVIDIASGPDEWVDAIERAIKYGGAGTISERTAIARANTWDARVDLLESWLSEMIETRA